LAWGSPSKHPEIKADGGALVVGGKTVTFDGTKITFGK